MAYNLQKCKKKSSCVFHVSHFNLHVMSVTDSASPQCICCTAKRKIHLFLHIAILFSSKHLRYVPRTATRLSRMQILLFEVFVTMYLILTIVNFCTCHAISEKESEFAFEVHETQLSYPNLSP